MVSKEDAGLAFSQGTKQPLRVPEFNLSGPEFGEMWCPPFAAAGGRRKGAGEGKMGRGLCYLESPNPDARNLEKTQFLCAFWNEGDQPGLRWPLVLDWELTEREQHGGQQRGEGLISAISSSARSFSFGLRSGRTNWVGPSRAAFLKPPEHQLIKVTLKIEANGLNSSIKIVLLLRHTAGWSKSGLSGLS